MFLSSFNLERERQFLFQSNFERAVEKDSIYQKCLFRKTDLYEKSIKKM